MMKKVFLTLLISVFILSSQTQIAEARLFGGARTSAAQSKEINNAYKAIKNLIHVQNEFCNNRNYEGLYSLYKDDFINNDGLSKDVYFNLIKDTWNSYPDIHYSTEIQSIHLTNNFATVETYETASATAKEDVADLEIIGYLQGFSHSVYYLERIGQKWQIVSENVLEENTSLKYGEALYFNINLNSPAQIGAGKSYAANLTVDADENVLLVASIGQEKISYPQKRAEEIYRRLSDENTLERVFTANTDNTNEYNIAAVGISRVEMPDDNSGANLKVYMSGIAFIMTRVNVVPQNNFIDVEENNEQKDK